MKDENILGISLMKKLIRFGKDSPTINVVSVFHKKDVEEYFKAEQKKWADEKKEFEATIQDFKEMKKISNNIIKQQIDEKVNTSELQVEFRIKEYKANLIKKIEKMFERESTNIVTGKSIKKDVINLIKENR